MKKPALFTATCACLMLPALPASADAQWQPPTALECTLAPGADCNVEAECPADAPYVVAGGGGMPKAEPSDHSVAMTMNLPVSENKWRVRWRNLSRDDEASIKGVVRVKCTASKSEAGW